MCRHVGQLRPQDSNEDQPFHCCRTFLDRARTTQKPHHLSFGSAAILCGSASRPSPNPSSEVGLTRTRAFASQALAWFALVVGGYHTENPGREPPIVLACRNRDCGARNHHAHYAFVVKA